MSLQEAASSSGLSKLLCPCQAGACSAAGAAHCGACPALAISFPDRSLLWQLDELLTHHMQTADAEQCGKHHGAPKPLFQRGTLQQSQANTDHRVKLPQHERQYTHGSMPSPCTALPSLVHESGRQVACRAQFKHVHLMQLRSGPHVLGAQHRMTSAVKCLGTDHVPHDVHACTRSVSDPKLGA